MPTYDYKCENGHVFEIFQSINADPVADCPTCSASARRMIGAGAGLMFKGSGFYITDYKKNGNNGKSGGKSSTGSTSSDSVKTTNPESKIETQNKNSESS